MPHPSQQYSGFRMLFISGSYVRRIWRNLVFRVFYILDIALIPISNGLTFSFETTRE